MGSQKPGFFAKRRAKARRYGKKPGFLGLRISAECRARHPEIPCG